jgi:hypothetical protein
MESNLCTMLYVKMNEYKQILFSVPTFMEFQNQRDEIGLDGTPEIEFVNLIDSSDNKWKK